MSSPPKAYFHYCNFSCNYFCKMSSFNYCTIPSVMQIGVSSFLLLLICFMITLLIQCLCHYIIINCYFFILNYLFPKSLTIVFGMYFEQKNVYNFGKYLTKHNAQDFFLDTCAQKKLELCYNCEPQLSLLKETSCRLCILNNNKFNEKHNCIVFLYEARCTLTMSFKIR